MVLLDSHVDTAAAPGLLFDVVNTDSNFVDLIRDLPSLYSIDANARDRSTRQVWTGPSDKISHSPVSITQTSSRIWNVASFMGIHRYGVGKAHRVEIFLGLCSETCVRDEPVAVAHLSGEVGDVTRSVVLWQHATEVATPGGVCVYQERHALGLVLLPEGQDGVQGVNCSFCMSQICEQ